MKGSTREQNYQVAIKSLQAEISELEAAKEKHLAEYPNGGDLEFRKAVNARVGEIARLRALMAVGETKGRAKV